MLASVFHILASFQAVDALSEHRFVFLKLECTVIPRVTRIMRSGDIRVIRIFV